MRNILILATVFGIIAEVPPIRGQEPGGVTTSPRFDVVSVKPNKSGEVGGSTAVRPDGHFVAENMALLAVIMTAYGLRGYDVAGGPSWIWTDHYDVDTRAPGNPPLEQVKLMLQAMLADRFKLSGHFEKRDVDGFALVTINSNKLGPNLHVAAVDCTTPVRDAKCGGGYFRTGDYKGVGMPLSRLTSLLGSVLAKPVADDTRLSQTFDITLRWSPDLSSGNDLPFIFTALQEQLGLRLDAKRVPIDVFVIDHVERPTPD